MHSRWLPALLLCVAGSVALAASGALHDAPPADAWPLAAAHGGDRVAYVANTTGEGTLTGLHFDFAWTGPAPEPFTGRVLERLAANATWHGLPGPLPGAQSLPGWHAAARSYWVDADGVAAVASDERLVPFAASTGTRVQGVIAPEVVQPHLRQVAATLLRGDGLLLPCLAVPPQDAGAGALTLPPCTFLGLLDRPDGARLALADTQERDGVPLRHYVAAGGWTELWLQPGLPYPVAATAQDALRRVDLRLDGFAPGTAPLRHDAHAPAPAPPAATAHRGAWGLGGEPAGHPFPLSTALAKAAADPAVPAVRDFLARHPDAYVAQSGLRTTRSATTVERAWGGVLAGGGEALGFQSIREERAWPLPATYATNAWTPTDRAAWPPPERVPAEGPSVAAAIALWREGHDGPADAEFAWGHTFACADAACAAVRTVLWVGPNDLHSGEVEPKGDPSDPRVAASDRFAWDVAWFDGQLRPLARSALDQGQELGLAPGLRPAPPPEPAAVALPGPQPGFALATAGAGLLLLAALWALLPKLKALLAFQWGRGPAESHPVRAAILALVRAHPGIHGRELERRLGRASGNVRHHLRRLERAGLVLARRSGRYVCYVPAGHPEDDAVGLLKAPGAAALLEAVALHPGASGRELAKALGLRPSTVSVHARRLAALGLLVRRRVGREVRLFPTG